MKFSPEHNRLKYWEILYYIDYEIDLAIQTLSKVNRLQEASYGSARKQFEDFVESNRDHLSSLPIDEQGAFQAHYFYDDEMALIELARIQRYSSVISIFAFTESKLMTICQKIEATFILPIKLKKVDARNGDLKKYYDYLTNVFDINELEIQHAFNEIFEFKFIRNMIVHYGGIVESKDLEKVRIAPGLDLSQIKGGYQIKFEDEQFVLFLLNKVKTFFKKLLPAIDLRFFEIKESMEVSNRNNKIN